MQDLQKLAKLVRYYILYMTTKAGSGHPTSSLSAADIMSALFFGKLRFDVSNPHNLNNDRVIFSKGHASPLFYALWAAAGVLSEKDLDSYRKFKSVLEGHPRPNFDYADVATGSLGQGLSVGVGMALGMRANIQGTSSPMPSGGRTSNPRSLPKVYVLLGDSEMAEGSVWEAISIASYYKLDNLVGIVDVNRLGQTGPTMLGWDVDKYKQRVEAFGWQAHVVDGHNMNAILKVLDKVEGAHGKPVMIIAKTIKGKGVSFLENKEGWHGKALNEEQYEQALMEFGDVKKMVGKIKKPISNIKYPISNVKKDYRLTTTNYQLGEEVATRKAYGTALAKLGDVDSRVVALDGETSNSTMSEIFREKHANRYFEMFIAEQNMAGVALGMSKLGLVPFASTFAAFLSRAHDQIRMGAYSLGNVKFVGSHSGVSIGEDGPSQMGLEDIALFRSVLGAVILTPADAVSCEKLVFEAAAHQGMVYLRTSRPATLVIYKDSENFKIGGSKTVRSSARDKLTIVACGVCVIEAIGAADELSTQGINVRVIDAYSVLPIDKKTIIKAAGETNNLVVTMEDHYFDGGLGDAVLNVFAQDSKVRVHKLAVSKMPTSGGGNELLNYEGISKSAIIKKVKSLI